jgi:hypothetical protein
MSRLSCDICARGCCWGRAGPRGTGVTCCAVLLSSSLPFVAGEFELDVLEEAWRHHTAEWLILVAVAVLRHGQFGIDM